MKVFLLSVLAVCAIGCADIREALKTSQVEFCVEYKGRKVCFGRVDGVWKFNAELQDSEKDELLSKVGAK